MGIIYCRNCSVNIVFTGEEQSKGKNKDGNKIVVIGNGNTLTMNLDLPNATALATKGDKILALGDLEEVKKNNP